MVSSQIGADGITDLLADMSSSRTRFQQAGMTAGFLAAGTAAADDAAQQLTEGADTLLPYLETARAGSVQLLEVADQVAGVVGETSGTANGLADRLSALGLTLGQANASATQMRTRIDDAIRVLDATPVASDVVPSLRQSVPTSTCSPLSWVRCPVCSADRSAPTPTSANSCGWRWVNSPTPALS